MITEFFKVECLRHGSTSFQVDRFLSPIAHIMPNHSRYLSRILRHAPAELGLELGSGGWVEIDALLKAMKKAGRRLTREDLESLVAENDKSRFSISPDGLRIRAAQGHSVPVDLQLRPATPPGTLFHGTPRSNLDRIFTDGLVPGRRQQVHLSPNIETAYRVGSRRGFAVVLTVDAATMQAGGFSFFKADNGVWLTDHVPAVFLGFAVLPDHLLR